MRHRPVKNLCAAVIRIKALINQITQETARLRNAKTQCVVNARKRALNIMARIAAQERNRIAGRNKTKALRNWIFRRVNKVIDRTGIHAVWAGNFNFSRADIFKRKSRRGLTRIAFILANGQCCLCDVKGRRRIAQLAFAGRAVFVKNKLFA